MVLSDKIIALRKKEGWSQEELAEKLGVTRQSVSKWEVAQSVPDIDKIIQMSRIFEVSTDYLLKEEIENTTHTEDKSMTAIRTVTLKECEEYLALQKANAPRLATATSLCIVSPVILIFLGALSAYSQSGIPNVIGIGTGLCTLLICIAIAVGIFLSCSFRVKKFEFLDTEPVERASGVEELTRGKMERYQPLYAKFNIMGTVLCILAAIPLFLAMCVNMELLEAMSVCILLVLVATGCFLFVYAGTCQNALNRILEEGDYTRENKARNRIVGGISACYWLFVTAIFLFYTFGPNGNGQPEYSWFIWAVAGVLFGAFMILLKILRKPHFFSLRSEP